MWNKESIEKKIFNKSKFIHYYPLGIIILTSAGFFWDVFVHNSIGTSGSAGLRQLALFLFCGIYAPILLPLSIISFITNNQKTAVILNVIATILLLLPMIMIVCTIVLVKLRFL